MSIKNVEKTQRDLDNFDRQTAGRKSPNIERERRILVARLEAEKARAQRG